MYLRKSSRICSDLSESKAGVYVVSRVGDPEGGCKACDLPFIDPLPPNFVLDLEYEQQRWLPNEPILYSGKRIDHYASVSESSVVTSAGIRVLMLAVRS
jgi:hypothetical protein